MMRKFYFFLFFLSHQLFFIASTVFADEVKIQVVVEDEVNGTGFRDAIYYSSMSEYEAKLSDGTHGTERKKRLDKFKNVLENPAPQIEPTRAQLQAEKSELEGRIAILDEQIRTR